MRGVNAIDVAEGMVIAWMFIAGSLKFLGVAEIGWWGVFLPYLALMVLRLLMTVIVIVAGSSDV